MLICLSQLSSEFTTLVAGLNFGEHHSFTYRVCDSYGACSTGTVTLNVSDSPPTAATDTYIMKGAISISAPGVLSNDSDPDGDQFYIAGSTPPAHGSLGLYYTGGFDYSPDPGYVGMDSFTYRLCDNFNICSTGTVNLFILESDDGENGGPTSCNAHVGEPINVTNGNMYLQQTDYQLPGIGEALQITRTYNSSSQRVNLFGRGWSTAYDEAIRAYSSTFLRLNLPDGRAVYFSRGGNTGAFAPLEMDFRGQIAQNGDGSFTLSLKDGSVHQFSAAGKLLWLVDRHNNQTVLTYDANNRLVSITDPFGRVLTLTGDANGRVLSISDSLGSIATYTYGSSQELQSVTYADGSRFQFNYGYSPNLVLTSVTDALGNVVEAHTYDGQGRALTSEKQGGVERVTLSYVSSTETDVTDALGRLTKYFFDKSKGRNVVTRVEGTCGCGSSQTQTWTYDAQSNVTSKTNALGQTTTYTYDANGNVLTMTDALGQTSYTYDQFGQVLTSTDAMGGVTTNTYDAQGNLLSAKDALDKTTTFTYDAHGLLLSATDARCKVTSFTYDTSGNLTQKTDAAGSVTTFAYDARGRLTSTTNALNQTTSYAYDAAGRVNKITRPDSSFVTFTYDLAGRRTAVTDARNNSTTFAYDTAYRLSSETDAASKTTTYSYDLMSNLTGKTDALGRTTNYEYDIFNRLLKTIYPAATTGTPRLQETVEYDAGGNVTKRTDPAGRLTSYEYDAANRLVKVTDPALQVTRYEYNARSQTTAVVDALNQRYTFSYDNLGHVTQASRGGLSMSFVYDAVGNRTQRTDYNGATTSYSYNALNRLTTIAYPDATAITYAYDQLSRLTSATNINGVVTLGYDSLSRLSSTTDVFGQTINYSYDANGNRTAMNMGTTSSATYQYDALNRLTQLTDGAGASVSYAYDEVSKLTARALPNGITTIYQYDGLDRLTRLRDSKGAVTIADQQYQYNDVGQIIQNIDLGGAHSYSYDAARRLTSATYPTLPNESYTYDAVGNRASSQRSASYSYQSFNRLTSTSTASYSYDNNGNPVSKTDSSGTWQYMWDYENRLTRVVRPDGVSVTYKYDALGRRVQRVPSSGASTNYLYDGQDVVQDRNSDSSTVEYLNGPGIDNKLRQVSSTNGTLYYVQDHLGSTTALADATGNVVERETYDSFGDSAGSTLTRYGYTGRERDEVTGLLYYRARWYDPQVGRFISEDPIGFEGGLDLYAYVENDPVNDTDPLGLSGGRGPGHSVSLKKDPWEWLRRFVGRRRRFDGDPGHATQLANRCRELEKWLAALTMVSTSEANLMRHLMKQYDWCRKKFPNTCNDPSLSPIRTGSKSPAPNPSASQSRTYYDDGVPRWDDGTPVDPNKYPEIYKGYRPGHIPIVPIDPVVPPLMPVPAPVLVPVLP